MVGRRSESARAEARDIMRAQRRDIRRMLHGLTPEQWRQASLCEAWTVRDLVAHLVAWDDLLLYRTRREHLRALLRFIGMGGTTETRSVTAVLPPDGYWYDCRIDAEHGFTVPQGFTQAHSTLRVSIGNFNPGQWLDVDQVLLGNYTNRITGTKSDPTGRPALGPTCTRGDVW